MSSKFTDPREQVEIPWGQRDRLRLSIPGDWSLTDVAWPELEGAIGDYTAALERALDTPLGTERIEQEAHAGTTVAIVVDDPSRWTPVSEALPVLLRRLHAAGVRTSDVSISVGVGRHHEVDTQEMRARVGDAVHATYRCFSPPVDELAQYVDLGTTPEGVPVRVFRPVAEADLRIMVGSVLPHLQAGFGGGYKLIFPGTSHRSTLGALHRMGLSGDPARLLGSDADHNPMRQAIRSAAQLLRGRSFSVSHLIGAPGQVLHLVAGQPDQVQEALAAEVRRRFRIDADSPADIVVVGNNPWPGDPLQSFKVLLNHRAAGRIGGVLAGFFWTDPDEIDRSFPLTSLRLIAATSAVGGWVIRRVLKQAERMLSALGSPSAFMLRWARELVVDRTVLVYAPLLHAKLGAHLGPIRLFADQGRLWQAAERALGGKPSLGVRVFPQGGLTYCTLSDKSATRDPGEAARETDFLSAHGGLR